MEMDTLTPASACRHVRLHISSRRATEFIDITERIHAALADSSVGHGMVNVQTLHTTTAIIVNEYEPLLLEDFDELLQRTACPDGNYRHDDLTQRTVNLTDRERRNGHAHCRALTLPTSVCLNVARRRLMLGRWQRVIFVELDGPQEREISVLAFGEAWR